MYIQVMICPLVETCDAPPDNSSGNGAKMVPSPSLSQTMPACLLKYTSITLNNYPVSILLESPEVSRTLLLSRSYVLSADWFQLVIFIIIIIKVAIYDT